MIQLTLEYSVCECVYRSRATDVYLDRKRSSERELQTIWFKWMNGMHESVTALQQISSKLIYSKWFNRDDESVWPTINESYKWLSSWLATEIANSTRKWCVREHRDHFLGNPVETFTYTEQWHYSISESLPTAEDGSASGCMAAKFSWKCIKAWRQMQHRSID